MTGAPAPLSCLWLFIRPNPVCPCLPCVGKPRTGHRTLHGCSQGALLAHVQLGVHQESQVLFSKAVFQPFGPQHVLVHGVIPPQVQGLAFPFADLQRTPVHPFLQPVWVPLNGSTTSWCVNHSSQFCIILNLLSVCSATLARSQMKRLNRGWGKKNYLRK